MKKEIKLNSHETMIDIIKYIGGTIGEQREIMKKYRKIIFDVRNGEAKLTIKSACSSTTYEIKD